MPETLADHLAKARAERKIENLRAGMEKARQQKQLKPCNCHRTDGTHKSNCPVYLREAQRKHRTPAE